MGSALGRWNVKSLILRQRISVKPITFAFSFYIEKENQTTESEETASFVSEPTPPVSTSFF